ncbi:MAG: hypothetical protein RLZZ24_407 [Pseudomonadota bacterium]
MHRDSSFSRCAVALAVALSLSACDTITESGKVNYKTEAEKVKPVRLDVPPDLTQLTRDTKYAMPTGGAVTASSMSAGTAEGIQKPQVAVREVKDVRLERDGKQRWLVVGRPAETIWPVVRDFWKENGFTYVIEQEQIGILETEWAENRAKIPGDFFSRALTKIGMAGLMSTGERDKFRTRIERNNEGGVDIFITHRGMSEEYKNNDKTQTIWAPRPTDPELESEFLNRLMVKLGVAAEQAEAAVNASKDLGSGIVLKTALENRSDGAVIVMRESYDVAWRRVGVTLDRTGFTVEDRDRSRGIYFVRYVDMPKQEDKGFFKNLFSSTPQPKGPAKYRIVVSAQRNVCEVRVQNEAGELENSEVTKRIYKLLTDSLQ